MSSEPERADHKASASLDALLALEPLVPPLQRAIRSCDGPATTRAQLENLQQAIHTFFAAGEPARLHTDHAWWLGMAHYALGSAALALGDPGQARDAFTAGAEHYRRANDESSATDLDRRATAVTRAQRGDFDAIVADVQAAMDSEQPPLARAKALAQLATAMNHAGDHFEFVRLSATLAELLVLTGFPDPEPDVDAAVAEWERCAATNEGGAFETLAAVAQHWTVVLGARAAARQHAKPHPDAAGVERALDTAHAIGQVVASQAATAAIAVGDAPDAASNTNPLATMASSRAILDALHAVRLAVNEEAREEHLVAARELVNAAEQLGDSMTQAIAHVEVAYVLLGLRRGAEVVVEVEAALSLLSPQIPAALDALTANSARSLYLIARQHEMEAHILQGDMAAALGVGQRTIRELEVQRVRVSTPYQQATFLNAGKELYSYSAAIAQRLDDHAALFDTVERLKASGARRLANARALRGEVGDAECGPDIADGPCSISALQKALAPHEAAVSWYWVSENVLSVMTFDTRQCTSHNVALTPEQYHQWTRYLTVVQGFGEDRAPSAERVAELETLIAALGPVFWPPGVREVLAHATQLVLSAHQGLHLFPLHAVVWDDGNPLCAHVACRYAPNLTSVTAPWPVKGVHTTTNGPQPDLVLAIGNDSFVDDTLDALPMAHREVQAVAALHAPNGQAHTNLSRDAFLELPLAACRVLHLATHGRSVLGGAVVDDPLACGVEFTDGELDGWAIGALDLRAELVVLASCHSGQRAIAGRGMAQLPGDDLLGLQAVFFSAGVGAVLGALWPVHDTVAHAVLVAFHRHYAEGATPPYALQRAIAEYRASSEMPTGSFYWAPFVLSSLANPWPEGAR